MVEYFGEAEPRGFAVLEKSMHPHRVAVMVDGGFFLKRLRHQFPDVDPNDPAVVARLIHAHAIRHKYQRTGKDERGRDVFESYDLYRIFFYDCPPLEKKMHRPVSKKAVDFAKTDQAIFRRSLHNELRKKRKVALRLGHLLATTEWRLKSDVLTELLKGNIKYDELSDDHFILNTGQKGVDMRLGLDAAALSYKRLVDQIVLVIGDSDFVPAAKLARREGIDVIIDPLGQRLHDELFEHTDGVRTPIRRSLRKLTPEMAESGLSAIVQEDDDD
ncbi:NYN domain-containing protein [Bradyrhizobium barranii subsp. barranii]|uniref:NYN domain-containing protein n=1 Tax=Bradyrhizobium barranii subsp. barranii TaxID=2823807 RepID=A0A939S1X0_9BRAD|nr:NYN domain-containing protein [Bradyrhizobium barranii]UEM13671.1 NYN domain-containing protein [Bradyrhizobium barranii subsp. barranii]